MTPHHFVSMLFTCAFSPDGKLLATADKVGHVVVWDAESGKSVKTLEAPGVYTWDPQARIHSIGGARSLAFSPDGAELVGGGMGKVGNIDHLEGKARLEFFDWQKGESLAVTESDKFKGLIQELAFHPEGKWLACAGGDTKGWILFADAVTRKLVTQEPAPMHIHRFVLNEQANRLFAAGHQRLAIFEIGA
jgi:WD40 repeat protein